MKIGWIGVGLMGRPMSSRLLNKGYELCVCDIDSHRREFMVSLGADFAFSPKELVEKTDVIFSMIPNANVLNEIVNGTDGILKTIRPGFTLIDMSTIDPDSSAAIAHAIEEHKGEFIRATVTGSTEFAADGTLGIMLSGKKELCEKYMVLFKILGNRNHYLGEKEEARYMKIIINMMIGNYMQMLSESLVLGEKSGLNWASMMECICDSSVAPPMMKAKKRVLIDRNFEPMCAAYTVEKDLNIALSLAHKFGVTIPVTGITKQNYSAMRSNGIADKDYAAILYINEIINGLCQVQS